MPEAIVDVGKLVTLSLGMSLLGFSFMLACLIYLAKQLGEARTSTERIATTMERIAAMIDRDLQEIKDLLRGH